MAQPRILIVEDDPINLMILEDNLQAEGYEIIAATGGEKAWHMIAAEPERFAVILLDRVLPDMDGLEILRRMKSDTRLAHSPVIMQTSLTAPQDVAEGLRAGAFYYLTKPFSADMLIAIVTAAIQDHSEWLALRNEARQTKSTLSCLEEASFAFRTPDEVRNIAILIANAAPDPGRVVMGLSELMLNAVEHGNLAIGYEEKSSLIAENRFHEEVECRLEQPEYAERTASLTFRRVPGETQFLIRDQGKGFDWRKFIEMSPERAFDTHGRGIAMSRLISFDRLEYRGNGNEVLGIIRG